MPSMLLAILGFLIALPALACEPCAEEWGLSKTAQHADAIIIGKRVTPKTPEEDTYTSGPAAVEITVESVLKGQLQDKTIQATAWSGMCTYGIVTPPQEAYVMFLKKAEKGNIYNSVNYGCAVKVLELKNDQVILEGKPLDIEQFKQRIQ